MAFVPQITTEYNAKNATAFLAIFGYSGDGKTSLLGTLPTGKTLIADTENGTMPIREMGHHITAIKSFVELQGLIEWLKTAPEAEQYKNICIDSISEIAEKLLIEQKAIHKDIRQAYGAVMEKMTAIIRELRDVENFNVILTFKLDRVKDENTGMTYYAPSMPGQKLSSSIPYFFDQVLCVRTRTGNEGEIVRAIQTSKCDQYIAKDRSRKLEAFEPADLPAILTKIIGE